MSEVYTTSLVVFHLFLIVQCQNFDEDIFIKTKIVANRRVLDPQTLANKRREWVIKFILFVTTKNINAMCVIAGW